MLTTRRHIHKIAITAALYMVPTASFAYPDGEILFHNETSDTTRIDNLLSEGTTAVGNKNGNEQIFFFANNFVDAPYAAGTLEHSPEVLVVNIDEFDCTTFVETALALAYTIGEGRNSWRDFVYNLQRLRYKNGIVDGFSSRLNYFSDFVIDNTHRGNIKEITSQLPGSEYTVKTIDYMSRNRDSYPALKDSVQYARIRETESGYRSHRFPYIKSSRVASKALWKELSDGDVVCITTKTPGLDVQHMGIIKKIDGVPYLLHASSAAGKVTVDKFPLHEYLRRNRQASGIRVIRICWTASRRSRSWRSWT